MKEKLLIHNLQKHILFTDVSTHDISCAISADDTLIQDFQHGEAIFSPQNSEKKLGFILLGKANVYSIDENRSVLLRTLNAGDTFGVSTLFGEENRFISTIIAKSSAKVIFFTKNTIENLFNKNSKFRTNYISFLSQRICFLNKKISCFTAGSVERKLAIFLCSQSDDFNFSLEINANSLAEMLNVGRASLYRAFDKFIEDGFILKDGKTITLIDRTALEKNYI